METLYSCYFMIIRKTSQEKQNVVAFRSSFIKKIYSSIFAIIFVLLVANSYATVYYVSVNGNDANTGTSPEQAWRSLDKVNSFTPSPGDQILFARGGQWHGTVNVNVSGSSANPIIIGAYGSGSNPVIRGDEEITGWTQYSGNIYRAYFTAEMNQLFIGDKKMKAARTPNSGYYISNSVPTSTSFTSSDLDAGIDYTGAISVNRTAAWALDASNITSSSGQTIQIESAPFWGLDANNGFFLMNKLEFLDQAGEWYYDSDNNYVYLWTPNGESPANYTVTGSVYDYGIFIGTSQSYITIRDLNLRNHKNTGIRGSFCNYITVDNNIVEFSEGYGVFLSNGNNTVTNNTIRGMDHSAMRVSGANCVISHNTIRDICLFDELGIPASTRNWYYGNAILTDPGADNNVISYNNIKNIGSSAINFYGQNTIVEYNRIDGVNLTKDDGAAIYTDGENNNFSSAASQGSVIRYNIISNSIGNIEGLNISYSLAQGIYLDEHASEIEVHDNTVFNCTTGGIFLHYHGNVNIHSNILYNNGRQLYTDDWITVYDGANNIIKNNQFFALENDQYCIAKVNGSLPVTYDVQDSNYFYSVTDNAALYGWSLPMSFSEWQSRSGKDLKSANLLTTVPESIESQPLLFINDSYQQKNISLGSSIYVDIDGNTVSGTITLKPFTSKVLILTTSVSSNLSPEILDQSFSIEGNQEIGTSIGQVFASDPDQDQTLTFKIIGGNDGNMFYIDGLTGVITTATAINATSDMLVDIVVEVTDNATVPLSASAVISITIAGDNQTSPPDLIAPIISSFSIPTTSTSLTVPILSFDANDDGGVTGYILTESAIKPSSTDNGWLTTVPSSYTFTQEGNKTLYAWAKDATGNISSSQSSSVIITLPDMSSTSSEYLFEEGAGVTVIDSKGSNDGTIINEEIRVEGVIGEGLQFTGSGYVNLGQCFGSNVQGEVTLSAWIKPSISEAVQGIIMHGAPNIDSYALYIYYPTRNIGFKTSGTTSDYLSVDNIGDLWDGNWHQLVVTYNGNEKKIYLDTKEIASVAANGNIESGEGYNLLIGAGRDLADPTMLYEGLIDEVRIYNYALSFSQISELYNRVNFTPETIFTTEYIELCEGDSYNSWTASGEYIRTLMATSGADSIVTTYLTVNPVVYTTEEVTINEGEAYNSWNASGEYQRVLTTVNGCDSIVTTNLIVIQAIHTTEYIELCEGESYNSWDVSGEYIRTLTAVSGADSVVTTYLTVNPVVYTTEEVTINEGEAYNSWTVSGEYQRVLTAVTGCDSIVTTNLIVLKTITSIEYIELCQGETYNSWDVSGEYTRTLTTVTGADSVVTTYLTVNPVLYTTEQVTINEGEVYYSWTVSGEYQRVLTAVTGCDSIVTTNLTVVSNEEYISQSIELSSGWNIFSSYLTPTLPNLEDVLKNLRESGQLIMVEDENGNTYKNDLKSNSWTNTIGDLKKTEGYKIQVESNCRLNITGALIELPLVIELKKGLNIISFPMENSVNAMEVVQPLIDDGVLIKVQDEKGNAIEEWKWWKWSGWRNKIRNFESGEGYKVEVSSDCVLEISDKYQKSGLDAQSVSQTDYYEVEFNGNGSNHMNINIEGLQEANFSIGDEIAAFDGDICVGAVKLTDFNIADNSVSINASIADYGQKNGFTQGNNIDLYTFNSTIGEEYQISPQDVGGEMIYKTEASVFVLLQDMLTDIEDAEFSVIDINMYPNPARDQFSIQFSNTPFPDTRIILMDITGKELQSRVVRSNIETFDIQTYPDGIYLVKTIFGNHYHVNKLIKN
ncbi:LamG-like jellyroll fold domain-containing protein [uncultured Draconibacterium sp.]|uniref:LamG-like jellyroll fold domain-containing protein n=1 Tax=uncultured Draconibacterium sp. TaxID=1573823 RepID=UPI002AA660B7|nr:LamG-like jellyroll fold domain-containing protein [uncultured Draconibacterium sp.]